MTRDLLPVSLQGDKNVEAICASCDHVFELENLLRRLLIYCRIDELPIYILDLLAWQFHVEGWEFAKTEIQKRRLIKEAISLHRLKGTLAGIEHALKLCDAEAVRIMVPKDRTFLSLSLSDEQRKAWYSLFPELRIVDFAYLGKRYMRYKKDFPSASLYPYISDASTRYGTRAYLRRGSTTIPLFSQEVKEVAAQKRAIRALNICERGKAFGIFYRALDRFLCNHEAKKRFYSVRVSDTYIDFETTVSHHIVYPSAEPIEIRYETVAEQGKRYEKLSFCDYLQGHTTITDARMRLCKRLHLFDENVVAQRRNAFCFLNERPIRIPYYNAELKIAVRGKMGHLRFPRRSDMSALTNVCAMLNEMKSLRDRILVDTVTKRQPVADGTITAGMNISIREVVNA